MRDVLLARQFAQRLMAVRAELAMVEAEIGLLDARRTALLQYIDQLNRLNGGLADQREGIVKAAREFEATVVVAGEASDGSAAADDGAGGRTGAATTTTSLVTTPATAALLAVEEASPALQAEVPLAAKRRPGRPKGSRKPSENGAGAGAPSPAAATGQGPARRGRKPEAPAAGLSASLEPAEPRQAATVTPDLVSDNGPDTRKRPGRKPLTPSAAPASPAPPSLRDMLASIGDGRPKPTPGRPKAPRPTVSAAGSSTAPTEPAAAARGVEGAGTLSDVPVPAAATPVAGLAPASGTTPDGGLADAVLSILRDRPGLTPLGEIAERVRKRLGVQRLETTPGKVLADLRKNGLVERVGHKWRISEHADALQAAFKS